MSILDLDHANKVKSGPITVPNVFNVLLVTIPLMLQSALRLFAIPVLTLERVLLIAMEGTM